MTKEDEVSAAMADAREAHAAYLEAQAAERRILLTEGPASPQGAEARGAVLAARSHSHDADDRYVLAAVAYRARVD